MTKIENNNAINQKANVFRQKTERIISVIKDLNCQGAIVTQLTMAAAIIEVQEYEIYIEMLTHSEQDITKALTLSCSELDIYIRKIKDAQHDFSNSLYGNNNPKQRDDELAIIQNLKDRISEDEKLLKYEDFTDCLDSWTKLQTDIDMLWSLLYDTISRAVLELESLYYIIREKTAETTESYKQ